MADQCLEILFSAGRRCRQRQDPPRRLPRNGERLSAGGEDRNWRRGPEYGVGERGARLHQVLTVVEHYQDPPVAKVSGQGVDRPRWRRPGQAHNRQHLLWNERRIGQAGELDEPHTARALIA